MGVVLLQYAKPEDVLYQLAMKCFHNCGLPQLKTIVTEYGIQHECLTLPLTLSVLIKHFYKLNHKKDMPDQDLHAVLSLRCTEMTDVCTDIADEDMLITCLDKDDIKAFQATPCLCPNLK